MDARVAFDQFKVPDVCGPVGSSLNLHMVAVRCRLVQALLRRLHCIDASDMLVGGFATGCI